MNFLGMERLLLLAALTGSTQAANHVIKGILCCFLSASDLICEAGEFELQRR